MPRSRTSPRCPVVAEPRSILVDGRACEFRRRLGPTAWVELEELLSGAHGFPDACQSTATVRSLAADLGMSKDAIALSMVRLRTAGVVAGSQTRTSTGAFSLGIYRIVVPDGIALDHRRESEPVSPAPRRVLPTRRPRSLARTGRLTHGVARAASTDVWFTNLHLGAGVCAAVTWVVPGVLSVWKLGHGQEAYYLDAVAAGVEDYYLGGEAPGRWIASGGAALGLAGEVDADHLHVVLSGCDPRTGTLLGQPHTVPGFDLTFRAPKSVSVLFGLGESGIAVRSATPTTMR